MDSKVSKALKIGAMAAGLGAVGLGGGLFAHDQIRGGGTATKAAMNDLTGLFKNKEGEVKPKEEVKEQIPAASSPSNADTTPQPTETKVPSPSGHIMTADEAYRRLNPPKVPSPSGHIMTADEEYRRLNPPKVPSSSPINKSPIYT
jgi:hypothetical protein